MVAYMSKVDYALINQYENKGSSIPSDSSTRISTFMEDSEENQRELFDGNTKEQKEDRLALLKVLFKIIENVNQRPELVQFALALLDGILEDKRTRVREFTLMEKSNKADKKVDTIGILYNYIVQNNQQGNSNSLDLACHILACCINDQKFSRVQFKAPDFLRLLKDMFKENKISVHAYSACVVILMKHNELALEFIQIGGF
jgi:hypothetical protein